MTGGGEWIHLLKKVEDFIQWSKSSTNISKAEPMLHNLMDFAVNIAAIDLTDIL